MTTASTFRSKGTVISSRPLPVDPALAGMANGLETFGSSYGPSLAPFGPFIAGTGAMIAFYEGS
jgi:hypothetical protein